MLPRCRNSLHSSSSSSSSSSQFLCGHSEQRRRRSALPTQPEHYNYHRITDSSKNSCHLSILRSDHYHNRNGEFSRFNCLSISKVSHQKSNAKYLANHHCECDKRRLTRHSFSLDERDPEKERKRRRSVKERGKNSPEMVGHKCRSLDSVLNASREITALEIQHRRSGRLNRTEVCATSPQVRTTGETSSYTSNKRKACKLDVDDEDDEEEQIPDDLTEEHVKEPRKSQKRKSLDELDAHIEGKNVVWNRKSRKRFKIQTRPVDTKTHVNSTSYCSEHSSLPQEEIEKLSNISDNFMSKAGMDESLNTSYDSKPYMVSEGVERCIEENDRDSHLQAELSDKGLNDCKEKYVQNGERQSNEYTTTEVHSTFNCSSSSAKDVSNSSNNGSDTHGIDSVKASTVSKEQSSSPVFVGNGDSTMHDADEKVKDQDLSNNEETKLDLDEGRRCGLCGGNSKGEPLEFFMPSSSKDRSDQKKTHQKNGPDKNHPGYSEWDAFGSEPGWLGPLLGPLDDHFGIAGVWVHQECAIWSPEVYFAGVGHIKNIRAALRRGKQLKCSRCARPGATIGCRIERCPRTYHLACARFERCFFDHSKFLMACHEHLHHFLPRLPGNRRMNSLNLGQIRLKRKLGEWKKLSQRAAQIDAEAEEKWQEKAGVDEEFIKRERKRLQRDLTRIAPVMVGGSDGETISDDWDSIAGSGDVIQCMKEMVVLPLLYPEVFTSLGVSPPRGVLLYGHPGTGKTLAVKALVGACAKGHNKIAYFARKGADCLGKYVGDAERQLRLLFSLAEKHQPSIIFFDEIDGLAPTRSQHQDQTHKSVVSTLLALMDGIKSRGSVVVIGATNRPDSLDPALRRPGRFDREIYFPLPSLLDRTAILTLLTRRWQLPPTADVISLLARQTAGFAGADLQALCAEAAMNSLRRAIPLDDLLEDVEKKGNKDFVSSPNLNVNMLDWCVSLRKVSPPCSWRSAKAAVNIVPNGPLPSHLVPVFLWPMVYMIISLHVDERVVLPPVLETIAILLKEKMESHFGDSWMANIASILHGTMADCSKQKLEHEFETVFCGKGMISRQGSKVAITQKVAYKGSKFRIMVSGKRTSGLNHLVSWLLFGFEGFLEMCNLNFTTMLQEGHGDAIQGLISILGNIQNKCPCVLYMPELEAWALEPSKDTSAVEASQCWNVFMQQVNSMPSTLQIIFLASTGMPKDDVPHKIVDFFFGTPINSGLLFGTTCEISPCRSVPSSWVEAPHHIADLKIIFSRAADDYGKFLSEALLCFKDSAGTCPSASQSLINPNQKKFLCKDSGKDDSLGNAMSLDVSLPVCNTNTIKTNSKPGMPLAPKCPGNLDIKEQSYLSVAISAVGYQLLYHPELTELRHATCKLRDGPVFVTKTKRKKLSSGSTDGGSSPNNDLGSIDLKGLVAVGLLAYNGTYVKAKDVASAVKEVLVLLMNRINAKVNLGKDPRQFSHLFHQAASLEDKIFSWAHHLRRFESVAMKKTFLVSNKGECLYTAVDTVSTKDQGSDEMQNVVIEPDSFLHEKSEENLLESLNSNSSIAKGDQEQDHQVILPANHMLNEVNLEFLSGSGSRLWEHCCAECLLRVKREFEDLFVRSWLRRGSDSSLTMADEVIGTCTSAISIELDALFHMDEDKATIQCVMSSLEGTCMCAYKHKKGKNAAISPMSYANGCKESKSSSQIVDTNNDFCTTKLICLCPLIKIISHMK